MIKAIKGIIFLLLVTLPAAVSAGNKLTIVHINDTHGQIEPVKAKDGSEYGGFARVAYVVDSLRTDARDRGSMFLFLHAGDALQGPPISNMTGGKLDFELLNEMGLDVMVAGNHEFDFGFKNLEELVEVADFPVISANVTDSNRVPLFEPCVEMKLGRQKLLIVGLTTRRDEIDRATGGIEIRPDTSIQEVMSTLGYGEKDVIIALTHIGHTVDSFVAERVPDVDLFVGGHSHFYTEQPLEVADALIVQAGAQTIFLGKLEADVKKGKITDWDYELIVLSDSIPQDPVLAEKVQAEAAVIDEKLGQPIGKTEVALVPGYAKADDELSLGALLAEMLKEETGVDFAFFNMGGVRAQIIPGDISMKDVLTALPFQNTVVEMNLNASQVLKLLETNIAHGEHSGGTLHLAGLSFEAEDSTAVDVKINGNPFDPDRTYKIATNNYLAGGGDSYHILMEGSDIYDTGTAVNAMLASYIERIGEITKP